MQVATGRACLFPIALCLAAAVAAQPANEDPAGGGDRVLFEFMGHVKQSGAEFVVYGYLTRVAGVPDDQLFAGNVRNEATARYTFVTNAKATAHYTAGNPPGLPPEAPGNLVLTLISHGSTTYYERQPPVAGCIGVPSASCPEDPAPFASGTPIAASSERAVDINSIIGPNMGMLDGHAQAVLDRTPRAWPQWRPGLRFTLTYAGRAVRTEAAPPQAFAIISGRAVAPR